MAGIMDRAKAILERAADGPEGAPVLVKTLLRLGSRVGVYRAVSKLVRAGRLLRVDRGVYVLPIEGKFGRRAPTTISVVIGLAERRGQIVAVHGAMAANMLGLTQQVPAREIYLTSGRSRRLKVGAQVVELRHAPDWQLALPGRPAGDAVRALAWFGPEIAGVALGRLREKLCPSELDELAELRPRLPGWLAQEISRLVAHT